jgi:hypothetical protein
MPVMMYREPIIAIGAGIASALLSTSVAVGSGIGLILAYFSLLPVLLVGLSQGPRSTTIATVSGIVCAILLTNIFQGGLFGISVALPGWLIVRYVLMTQTTQSNSTNWLPIGEVLARLVAFGGIILVLSAITYFDSPGGLPKSIETFLDKMISARFQFGVAVDRQLIVERLVPLFPAVTVSSWVLMTLVNSLLAQSILIKASINLRPTIYYSKITVPEWIYWAIVGSGTLALIGSGSFEYIGRNLSVILAIPFFLVGLSVIHTMARQLRSPGVVLVAFYFFMVISSWVIFVAAIIGFFEEWNQIRGKYKAITHNAEDDTK